jgi:hypothetical protein
MNLAISHATKKMEYLQQIKPKRHAPGRREGFVHVASSESTCIALGYSPHFYEEANAAQHVVFMKPQSVGYRHSAQVGLRSM